MNGRGDGRIFQRKGSRFWWISYYRNGQEHREPAQYLRDKKGRKAGDKVEASGEERNEAVKFLKHRLGELAAERHGGPVFVGPEQQRITVSDLLDSLEADYKLRGKGSPQFRSHLKRVREYFGNWRAVEVSVEAVDKFISEQLEQHTAAATINRSTQLLAQAFRLAMERRRLSNAPVIRHLSERGNARQGFFTDAMAEGRNRLPSLGRCGRRYCTPQGGVREERRGSHCHVKRGTCGSDEAAQSSAPGDKGRRYNAGRLRVSPRG